LENCKKNSDSYDELFSNIKNLFDLRNKSEDDFRKVCSDFGEGTYKKFFYKHRKGNPVDNSELFEQVAPGSFKVISLFKYDL